MSLVKSGLRSFDQEARGACREECIFQFLLSRRIKRDGAQRLRPRPAFGCGGRNRLVEWTQRRRRRNLVQKFGRIFFAGSEFRQAIGRSKSKIRFREACQRFVVKCARVRGIPAAFGNTAKPVERVHGVCGDRIFQQECLQLFVGIGQAIDVGNPGDAPFGIVVIPTVGSNLQDPLVIARSACCDRAEPNNSYPPACKLLRTICCPDISW